jgi:hypothetical protein
MNKYLIDARMVKLFNDLRSLNPKVGRVINALNVVLGPDEQIKTKEDFMEFLDAVEEWEDE